MALIQTLLHYASYLAAFYALYLLAGSLAFGAVLWQKVYGWRCACVSITSALKAVSVIRITAET